MYSIPATGGAVASGVPMGFRVFGEIVLPGGYANSGQYLAYGTDSLSVNGVAAPTGASGLGAPINGAGDTVAHYLEGGGAAPLDPRGLLFVNDTTLLVANADPSIQELTPSDFGSGSPVLEPSTWAMILLGFSGLGYAASRGRRMTAAAAA